MLPRGARPRARGQGRPRARRAHDVLALYWHFVDAVWVVVFTVVYVIGTLMVRKKSVLVQRRGAALGPPGRARPAPTTGRWSRRRPETEDAMPTLEDSSATVRRAWTSPADGVAHGHGLRHHAALRRPRDQPRGLGSRRAPALRRGASAGSARSCRTSTRRPSRWRRCPSFRCRCAQSVARIDIERGPHRARLPLEIHPDLGRRQGRPRGRRSRWRSSPCSTAS